MRGKLRESQYKDRRRIEKAISAHSYTQTANTGSKKLQCQRNLCRVQHIRTLLKHINLKSTPVLLTFERIDAWQSSLWRTPASASASFHCTCGRGKKKLASFWHQKVVVSLSFPPRVSSPFPPLSIIQSYSIRSFQESWFLTWMRILFLLTKELEFDCVILTHNYATYIWTYNNSFCVCMIGLL